ncbi:hypothetical protein Lal_00008035 [Lupinus albus]|nr:hypothetical protein Lal_00008035 [Lupinus albus]
METGGSSSMTRGRNIARRDPYYSPNLQATRLGMFQGRKLAYTRYADISWLIDQGFEFPHQLNMHGVDTFLELHGKVYPSLIWEFYSNFQWKDGVFISLVKGKLITLIEELLLEVGKFTCFKYPYGAFENSLWNTFERVKVYKWLLRNLNHYDARPKPKATSLAVEYRLILVPCDANHDEPTTADLLLMFVIKERVIIHTITTTKTPIMCECKMTSNSHKFNARSGDAIVVRGIHDIGTNAARQDKLESKIDSLSPP